jgi:hypothetical protein
MGWGRQQRRPIGKEAAMQALERHPWAYLALAVLMCALGLWEGHRAVVHTKGQSIELTRSH